MDSPFLAVRFDEHSPQRMYAFFWLIGLVVALGWFFRGVLATEFQTIMGDDGDGFLMHALFEHWYLVLRGEAPWDTPHYFYPLEGSLGYTDTFFLFGLIHACYRFLGFEIFTALPLTLMTVAAAGYAGMYVFLTRSLGLRPGVSIFGCVLFVVLNAIWVNGSAHYQMLAVWLLGWPAHWSLQALRNWKGTRRQFLVPGSLAIVAVALLALNSFYTCWFFVFYVGVVLAVFLFFETIKRLRVQMVRREEVDLELRISTLFSGVCHDLKINWLEYGVRLVCLGVVGILALGPFLAVYLPALGETGGYPYALALTRLPGIEQFFYTLPENVFWGALYHELLGWQPEVFRFGYGPIFLVFSMVGTIGLVLYGSSGPALDSRARAILIRMWLGVALCSLLMLRVDEHSLWYFVYHLVPGANAIRVAFRFNIVLIAAQIPILVALLQLIFHCAHKSRSLRRGICLSLGFGMALLLLGEQVSGFTLNRVHRPSIEALSEQFAGGLTNDLDAFVVQAGRPHGFPKAMYQTYAHLMAAIHNVPTLNGQSGHNPVGWMLRSPEDREQYERGLLRWRALYPNMGYVRGWDPVTGYWSEVAELNEPVPALPPGTNLFDHPGHALYFGAGWHGLEPFGVWSGPGINELRIPLDVPKDARAVSIEVEVHHLTQKGRRHAVVVYANDRRISRWEFLRGKQRRTEVFRLSADQLGEAHLLELRFESLDAIYPHQLDPENTDSRRLGMGLNKLTVAFEK